MRKALTQLLVWLGIMAGLTLLSVVIWMLFWGGSSTTSLKWMQCLQAVGSFLFPPLLCAWMWADNHRPFVWLKLDKCLSWQEALLAVAIMVCAIPAINLLADWNSQIVLPDCLKGFEQWAKQQEETAARLTERFLKADNVGVLLINIGLMALLPAIAEELSFRGTLQQIFGNQHAAIWTSAIIFSAIHMQFYGFIPRMLMGAMFGYVFVWTGNLWVPILMHFTNNGLAVLVYYLVGESADGKNYADTIGAGTTWWLGLISLVITSLGLLLFYRRTHTR